MTMAPAGVAPIGRAPVLAVLHSSVTAVVTGRSGSGLTCVLRAAAGHLTAGGHCVVAGTASPGPSALPLSYLAGLRIPGADGTAHHLRWPVTPWRPEPGGTPVPLPDLPWFVELTAQEIQRTAGGRPVALLLDDLDLADALSLSVLPLLRRRLRARLIGAGHAPAPGIVPRTAFAALIDRLPGPSRIHLEGLSDEHCLEVARLRDPSATPALVRVLRPALGSWGCLPGLVLGVLDVMLAGGTRAGRPLRLPEDHPLVHRLLHGHGTAAALVAAAGSSGGLRYADLQVLAAALDTDHDQLAETVDLLTADGLLDHDGGVWGCAVPALAAALAPRALPPAALIALTVRAWLDERNRPRAAEGPAPTDGHTGGDGHREETAHRVTELAWHTDGHPAMLDLLLDTALARRSRAQAPGAPVPLLRPDLYARLLAAIATAAERAGPTGPDAALATGLADAS
ncbi:MAG TPA: hypothetical protein VFP72_14065, partial [Kineosporiaceae bacterium]|nr:hypothetical protein [Kineosporiaceae bacterium]